MKTSDPIANLLTTISNASRAAKTEISVPYSQFKEEIVKSLKAANIITAYKTETENNLSSLIITLPNKSVGMKRVSKPGRRVYVRATALPKFKKACVILSTPKGVMTNTEAYKKHVGGEVILEVL